MPDILTLTIHTLVVHDCRSNLVLELSDFVVFLRNLDSDSLCLVSDLSTLIGFLGVLVPQNVELVLETVDHILLAAHLSLVVTLESGDGDLQSLFSSL